MGLVVALDNQDDIDALNRRVADAQAAADAARAAQTASDAQIASLRTQVTSLSAQLGVQAGQITTANANIIQLRNAISGLQTLLSIQANVQAIQSAALSALAEIEASTTLTPEQRVQLRARVQSLVGAAGQVGGQAQMLGSDPTNLPAIGQLVQQFNEQLVPLTTVVSGEVSAQLPNVIIPSPQPVSPPPTASPSAP